MDRTAKAGFKMKEVSADKGYLGAFNMLATLQRGAIPDSRGSYGAKSELWTRMFHFYSLHRAEFFAALSQTLKRRNGLPHDQK